MKVACPTGSVAFPQKRAGAVVPLVAFMMVALIAFLALAIDLGAMTISKVQAQNAADMAALAAARTLSGPNPSNKSQATTNARTVLANNNIVGQSIQPTVQMGDPSASGFSGTPEYGAYQYDDTTQSFVANWSPSASQPISAVYVKVTSANSSGNGPSSFFATIFGVSNLGAVTAYAQAVHRPRDVALIMDLSNSMRFSSLTRFDFAGTSGLQSNNPDTVVPKFSQYSMASPNLIYTSAGQVESLANYYIPAANMTATTTTYAQTYVNSFYSSAAYATTLTRAFDSFTSPTTTTNGIITSTGVWSAPSSGATPQLPSPLSGDTYGVGTVPGYTSGDYPLFKNSTNSTTTFAQTVSQAVPSSWMPSGGSLSGVTMSPSTFCPLWELDGYSAFSQGLMDTSGTGSVPAVWTQSDYSNQPFKGYTQGPGYYGKTFFIWPPDPRTTTALSGATLKTWLNNLGMTDTTDQATVAASWSTWTLAQLQTWLAGGSTHGGPYTATSTTKIVPGSGSKAPIYYAVCRLYNRAYPGGTSAGTFSADWRSRFFGTTTNNSLFNSSSYSLSTSRLTNDNVTVNYPALLSWIASSPNPFPTQMRAARISYYTAIPTTVTQTTSGSSNWPSYGSTDQRFWKECIDYMLGIWQPTSGTAYTDISTMGGYNQDYNNQSNSDGNWGTLQVSGAQTAPQSISYSDNPARGQLRYWFGPLMMVDYICNDNMYEAGEGNFNLMDPGDGYIAPAYSCKQGFLGAVNAMQQNHPNDWFSLMFYDNPRSSSTDTSGAHNCVACPLGTNYNYAASSLFFPFSTITLTGGNTGTEVTPYDVDPQTSLIPSANFRDVSRPYGSTSFAMGLMLAYNQFITTPTTDSTLRTFTKSTPIAFPTGMAGGLGRKGAQKVIIFETDGEANYPVGDKSSGSNYATAPSGTLSGSGYNPLNYYQIRYDMNNPSSSEYPYDTAGQQSNNASTVVTQILGIVQTMGGTTNKGTAGAFGSTRNPFRLYAMGFGPCFDTNVPSSVSSGAKNTLAQMQVAAGTSTSTGSTSSISNIISNVTYANTTPQPYVITGSDTTMTSQMTTAFTGILQNGIQIALTK